MKTILNRADSIYYSSLLSLLIANVILAVPEKLKCMTEK